jgi:ankyrin repeat protein
MNCSVDPLKAGQRGSAAWYDGKRGNKVRRRTVVVGAPAVLVVLALVGCLSTNPQTPGSRSADQTTDFYNLLQTGTPEQVQGEIDAGAVVNAQEETLGFTPLMWAAGLNPNPEVITVLLKAGAHINARVAGGMTPLMWAAARNRSPEVIAALLDAGADAKVKDRQGRTAFDFAQQNASLKETDAYRKLEEASK